MMRQTVVVRGDAHVEHSVRHSREKRRRGDALLLLDRSIARSLDRSLALGLSSIDRGLPRWRNQCQKFGTWSN